LNIALTTSILGAGDYVTPKYKGALLTAVIGLLNGVSLPPASLLTQAVAPPGWKPCGPLTYFASSEGLPEKT